jgi:hypothetical protein
MISSYLNECFKQLFEMYAHRLPARKGEPEAEASNFRQEFSPQKRNARIFIRALLRGLGEGT